MISIKELRIGNYVKCAVSNDAGIYQILNLDGWMLRIELYGIRQVEKYPERLIKPIQLTEDILIKCGFVGFVGHTLYKQLNDTVITMFFERGLFSIQDYDWFKLYMPHIKYLHQLQNLVYSLTNEELTFTL